MESNSLDLDEVLLRLEHDVGRTVGDAHRAIVREVAEQVLQLDLDDHTAKLVDDVQQVLHDTFVDTVWPACPRHPQHPLWYRDGSWWCETDNIAVAALGALPTR